MCVRRIVIDGAMVHAIPAGRRVQIIAKWQQSTVHDLSIQSRVGPLCQMRFLSGHTHKILSPTPSNLSTFSSMRKIRSERQARLVLRLASQAQKNACGGLRILNPRLATSLPERCALGQPPGFDESPRLPCNVTGQCHTSYKAKGSLGIELIGTGANHAQLSFQDVNVPPQGFLRRSLQSYFRTLQPKCNRGNRSLCTMETRPQRNECEPPSSQSFLPLQSLSSRRQTEGDNNRTDCPKRGRPTRGFRRPELRNAKNQRCCARSQSKGHDHRSESVALNPFNNLHCSLSPCAWNNSATPHSRILNRASKQELSLRLIQRCSINRLARAGIIR